MTCNFCIFTLGLEGTVRLSEGRFKDLWNRIYGNVKVCQLLFHYIYLHILLQKFLIKQVRKLKRVSGKCWTCAHIHEVRSKQKGRDVAQACKDLMMMHKGGLFMLERLHYRMRIAEAVVHYPDKVMSTIIDGSPFYILIF